MAIKIRFEIYGVTERVSGKTQRPYAVADVGVFFEGATVRGEMFVQPGTKAGIFETSLECYKRDGNVQFGLARGFVAVPAQAPAK